MQSCIDFLSIAGSHRIKSLGIGVDGRVGWDGRGKLDNKCVTVGGRVEFNTAG